MRRLIPIAAFALFLAVPVWAQHGGHGGGSGGHAGFGGGHSGGFAGHASGSGGGRVGGSFGGGHMNGGSRGFSGYHGAGGLSRGYPRWGNNFSHQPFLHDGWRNRGLRTYGFRNSCYGYRCGWRGSGWGWGYGYPWWGSAYYDPWWWNQDDQQFNADYYGQYQAANEMNEQSLEEQRMWRQEEADGDQDAYAPRRPQQRTETAPLPESHGQPIMSPTVLVFRDQHRQEIQNYAIVGSTLWNFAAGQTQKIALADLDVPTTEKANEDRGVTFRVPGSTEGQ